MNMYCISEEHVKSFGAYLAEEEKSSGTAEKYLWDIRRFAEFLQDAPAGREQVIGWKEHLLRMGYAPVTVNSMLAAVRCFFRFMGWDDRGIRYLRLQRRMFRESRKELTREEYRRLYLAAQQSGKQRLELLLETICATGIRVSEVRFITVEALRRGVAEVSLKGKIRTILIPAKLSAKLLKYARSEKIASGEVFLTRSGKSISRKQIWAEMKSLCKAAGVEASKVFPHNLRHLFARTFYKITQDVAKLADVLGHSSIETTRIYLISTGAEHRTQLERMQLIN